MRRINLKSLDEEEHNGRAIASMAEDSNCRINAEDVFKSYMLLIY